MAATPEIARENGKKGGRPKGFAALEAERARVYIAKRVKKNLGPIVTKAINQAKEGNNEARNWLSERAWGKAAQPLTGEGGEGPVEITVIKYADKPTPPVRAA